ncbi:MAG: phosphate ABC transporter substrate-binding protein [candidate division KSB1 bacterium]|nr:phosphate ABC transporter substrate-binding protein [candidate division KSB1 bacterium]
MKKWWTCFLLLTACLCAPPVRKKPTIIRIVGSDTLLLLTGRWAEEYMKQHPEVSIHFEGGGTKKGVEALIDGRADICTASRPLNPSEVRLLAERYKVIGMSHLVAKDALSIYLHPDNPVQNLTRAQLKDIFTGVISNWRQIGGLDEPILVIVRSPNSGTYQYFKEHVLNGENYVSTAVVMPTTPAVAKAVAEHRAAIGYGGAGFGSNVRHCSVDGVEPTAENVRNDSYPLVRYLYFVTANTPRGAVKAFIDWVLRDGQKIVGELGYFPLWGEP